MRSYKMICGSSSTDSHSDSELGNSTYLSKAATSGTENSTSISASLTSELENEHENYSSSDVA